MKLVIKKLGIKNLDIPRGDDSPPTLDDNDVPPDDYIPEGWPTFQLLGPFAEKKLQMDFFADVDYNDKQRSGRNASRATESTTKALRCDLSFDYPETSNSGGTRGIGVENRKYIE